MSHQYRTTRVSCPLCGSAMEDRAASDAIVDVCSDCHAVWIDWFDGDIGTLAADIQVPKVIPQSLTDKRPCPRCHVDLVAEKLYGHGPHVYRCGDCSGVLVPSAVLEEVVGMVPSAEQQDSADDGPIARAIAKLRRVFGASN